MDIETYLELLARAQTVFDLRAVATPGGVVFGGPGDYADPRYATPRGLERARDNLLSLCGRELGRFAVDTVTAYVAFHIALWSREPGKAALATKLADRFEKNRVLYLRTIEGGDRDSLPAWKFLGVLYRFDPGIDTSFETELLPPYRVCRDLTALRLGPRTRSGPPGSLHLLGLVAFADLFSVFRLDFDAFLRLLERYGRPLPHAVSVLPPKSRAGSLPSPPFTARG